MVVAPLDRIVATQPQHPRGGLRVLMLAVLAPLALSSCDVSNDGLGTPQITFDGAAVGGTTNLRDARGADAIADAGTARDAGPSPRDGRPNTDARPPDVAARDMAVPDAPSRDSTPPPPDAPPPLPDTPPMAEVVLLLIGDMMPSPGDMAVRARLVALGFQVQFKQVINAVQATEARAMAAGVALVIMSGSLPEVNALPVGLRTVAVPILCSHSAFWAALGIAQTAGSGVSQGESDLEIVATAHPLTAGRNGEIRVVNQPRPFG